MTEAERVAIGELLGELMHKATAPLCARIELLERRAKAADISRRRLDDVERHLDVLKRDLQARQEDG